MSEITLFKFYSSVLVHGVFNVPCHKPNNLNKEWWGIKAKLKQTVHFTVLKADTSQKVPQILGDLQNIGLDGKEAQNITFDETVPSPPVEEYSDDDWDEVIQSASKNKNKSSKSPTKAADSEDSEDDDSDSSSSESEAPKVQEEIKSPKKNKSKGELLRLSELSQYRIEKESDDSSSGSGNYSLLQIRCTYVLRVRGGPNFFLVGRHNLFFESFCKF